MKTDDEKITELCETIPDDAIAHATAWLEDNCPPNRIGQFRQIFDRYEQMQAMLATARKIEVSIFHGNFVYTHHEILIFQGENVQVRHCGGGKYIKDSTTKKVAIFKNALEAFAAITEEKNERNDK